MIQIYRTFGQFSSWNSGMIVSLMRPNLVRTESDVLFWNTLLAANEYASAANTAAGIARSDNVRAENVAPDCM